MAWYCERPAPIQAEKIADLVKAAVTDWQKLPDWVRNKYEKGDLLFLCDGIDVRTGKGVLRGKLEDMLIYDANDRIYPCELSLFEEIYERV